MSEDEVHESGRDSFTLGTPSSGGAVKVYFDEKNAEEKIKKAKDLYFKYVEYEKLKKAVTER